MSSVAAVVYIGAAVVTIAFQLALALGAPWGEYAMGGRFPGRFPAWLRVAEVVQAAIIAVLAVIVATRAGLVSSPLDAPWLAYVTVAVSAVSLVMNAASRSAGERRIWVPVGLVMLASSLVVAVS